MKMKLPALFTVAAVALMGMLSTSPRALGDDDDTPDAPEADQMFAKIGAPYFLRIAVQDAKNDPRPLYFKSYSLGAANGSLLQGVELRNGSAEPAPQSPQIAHKTKKMVPANTRRITLKLTVFDPALKWIAVAVSDAPPAADGKFDPKGWTIIAVVPAEKAVVEPESKDVDDLRVKSPIGVGRH